MDAWSGLFRLQKLKGCGAFSFEGGNRAETKEDLDRASEVLNQVQTIQVPKPFLLLVDEFSRDLLDLTLIPYLDFYVQLNEGLFDLPFMLVVRLIAGRWRYPATPNHGSNRVSRSDRWLLLE